MPFATVSTSPVPSASSTRIGMTWAPGATQRSRATRNARDARTGSISPARACSTPLSGADSVVSHELEDVSGAAAKRRRRLGRLVRADEVERLLRRLDERDEALEAAETP